MRQSRAFLLLVSFFFLATSVYAVENERTSTIGFDLMYSNVGWVNSKSIYIRSSTEVVRNQDIYPNRYWGASIYINHMFSNHFGTEGGFYIYSPSEKKDSTMKLTLKRKGIYGDFIINFNTIAALKLGVTVGARVEDWKSGSNCSWGRRIKRDGGANCGNKNAGQVGMPAFDLVPMVIGVYGDWHFLQDMGVRLAFKYTINAVKSNTNELNVNLGMNYKIN